VTEPIPSKCAGHGGPGIPANPCLVPGSLPRCQLCPSSPTYFRRAEVEVDEEVPNWEPLRALLPADRLDGWMWMGRSTWNSAAVEHYKHSVTRGSVTLDHDSNGWMSRISQHGCSPWCDERHEHVAEVREYYLASPVEELRASIAESIRVGDSAR